MADKAIWSDHLVRSFVRSNAFKPLVADEAFVTRERSPTQGAPTWDFKGQATIVFSDTDALYRGGALIEYSSIQLSKLFLNVVPEVWLYNPRNTREIAAELIRKYGIPLLPEWFVAEAFDHTTLPKTVTLKINRTNFTVQDELAVKVSRADAQLSEIFEQNVLASPKVPFELLEARTNVEFSYKQDMTPDNLAIFKEFQRYPAGVCNDISKYSDQALQMLANTITERLGWQVSYEKASGLTPKDLCFRGSELVYNGSSKKYVHPVNDPSSPGANTWYDNVLVVRFDSTYSGVHGLGYFHYNNLSS